MILLKALAGGCLVVLFSLIAEAVRPKTFAGLFSAAPSVALASLLIGAIASGPSKVLPDTLGMAVGSAGMVVYCLVAAVLVRRVGAVAGSVLAWGAWSVVAFGLYLAVLA